MVSSSRMSPVPGSNRTSISASAVILRCHLAAEYYDSVL